MSDDTKTNFIFRRRHRKLTVLSILLIAPLLLAVLSVVILEFASIGVAGRYVSLLMLSPYWLQALVYIGFPLASIYYSFKAGSRGTLYSLRKLNKITASIAVLLLLLEATIILFF